MHNTFNIYNFSNLNDAKFSPELYSKLKFGSDFAAKTFGHELAKEVFQIHADLLLANRCVVFSSPFNYVKNAATLMTEHFINKLNQLLVEASGKHVEYSVVHRKVTYTADYGFLSKDQRKGLIDKDEFYLNTDFIKDKLLIFIDDVKITGSHEERLIEELKKNSIKNDVLFLYYAKYHGNQPDIEGALNFFSIKSVQDLLSLSAETNYKTIIRPIKYILGYNDLNAVLDQIQDSFLANIYYGSLAEGYYKVPSYQENFNIISKEKEKRKI